ncbi:hypothetical protein L3Y34_016730 [Caenorhabditis briggsae]|uniref:Uncharacterized protein n=1 Tax=Caenorhabditis briggsae TaxID=6238 RepID=A0AAE9E093_CAEBR|nr:hypothetical protein L3Y34_016730 [Caenorhabditis briggsae]
MEPGPPKKRKITDSSPIQVVDLSLIPPLPSSDVAGPSTSDGTVATVPQGVMPQGQMDSKLRELLLSSPACLFGHQPVTSSTASGAPNGQAAVTSWENWLCVLATNLSPAQWQGYWLAHCALFGEQAVPVHMLSFFQGHLPSSSSASPSSSTLSQLPNGPHPNDPIHERYEMGNAASGGSSGTSRSRGGGGGASSGNDYNNSMVFSNGRLAAAETSEFFCWKGGVWFG